MQRAARIPDRQIVRTAFEQQVLSSTPHERLVDFDVSVQTSGADSASLKITAECELTEPRFVEVPADGLLQEQGIDPATVSRIRRIMARPDSGRLCAGAGLQGDATLAALSGRFVRQSAAAGTRVTYFVDATARRTGSKWAVDDVQIGSVRVRGTPPNGRFRADLGTVTDVADAATVASLHSVAAKAPVVLSRLEDAVRRREAEQFSFAEGGALFVGEATNTTNQSVPLSLEIVSADRSSGRIEAMLRNDGGWLEARRFQGKLSLDSSNDRLTVNLGTRDEHAIPHAGPFLEWNESWTIELAQDGDALAGRNSLWSYRFKRVPDTEKQAVVVKASAAEAALRAVAHADALLKVSVSSERLAWSEENYLRFTKTDKDGWPVEAQLESRSGRYRRHFRVQLIANSHRADGKPLRLVSSNQERVLPAGELSPLGWGGDLRWEFRFNAPEFSMDTHWNGAVHFRAEAISAAEVAKIRAKDRQAAADILARFPPRTRFEGATRSANGGHSSRVRLTIVRREPQGDLFAIEAVLESVDAPGVKRLVRGTLDTDPSRAVLSLKTLDAGTITQSDRAPEPWFRYRGEYAFTFKIEGDELDGRASDEWTVSLRSAASVPVAGAAGTAASEALPAESPDGDAVDWRSIPNGDGAYLLRGGKWESIEKANQEFERFQRPQQTDEPGLWRVGRTTLTPSIDLLGGVLKLRVNGKALGGDRQAPSVGITEFRAVAIRGKLRDVPSHFAVKHPKINLCRVEPDGTNKWVLNLHMRQGQPKFIPGEGGLEAQVETPQSDLYVLRLPSLPEVGSYALATEDDTYVFEVTP